MKNETVLKVSNLTMGYEGRTVLNSLSFSLREGDRLCVVGENGSGKSTLIKGIAGLLPPKSGAISFGSSVKKTQVGYLPQANAIQKDFPACVCEVVLSGNLGRHGLFGRYSREDKKRADDAIERLGIGELHHRSFGDLSGGQKQRVLLARAICATQRILLLDEPCNGLDPTAASEFYKNLRQLSDSGITIIMVTHDISGALKFANKILHLGTDSVFFGSTAEYLERKAGFGNE